MAGEILPGAEALIALRGAIRQAAGLPALVARAGAARAWAVAASESGVGAEAVTRALSLLNDEIVARLLELTQTHFRLPPASWCWLGLGSEGRMEQTLTTDQDNAFIFAASDGREARELREHMLPFARAINQALADCGFPLCDGDVMAGNPTWCLSLDEWRECFSHWIRTPEPEALLNASIFFDFRPLFGDAALAEQLRRHLTGIARGNDIFLRMMAVNALQAPSPLGRIKDFVTDADAGDSLDLKKFGSRLFVDAARILALADGVAAASTIARLNGLVASGSLRADEAAAAHHAFVALQGIRLDVQRTGLLPDNRVVPEQLNEFDRRILLEALRQARNLQRRLKTRFHIES